MSTQHVRSYIWDDVEALPPLEMEKLQVERLRAGIDRVSKTVPFYSSKLREAGVSADDIRSLEDLDRLPFTTKQDLRDNYPFGLVAVPMKEVIRLHASSGTTGKPTVVAYTRNDIQLWSDLMARTYAAAGVTDDDVVHNAYGYGLFTGGLGFHYGAERLGATVIPVSGGNTKRQLMIMSDFGSTALCCTPSYSLLIAELAEEDKVDLKSLPLKVGMFGAEPWSERMREEIESRLNIVALNVYGLSEVIGPGVSIECTEKQGMHIFEDHFIPEIIDPNTGQRLPDGEVGELVFTCVTKEALPLIRYRTRDRTRLMRGKCACGRTTVRMERVIGRTDDMIIVRGVNVFPSQIETVLLQVGGVEPHYQIVVDRSADYMDELDVLVETPAEIYGDQERLVQLEKRLSYDVQSALGITCKVKLVGPRGIARSEGKAVRVVDKRNI
ncbi:MAG TPA: phenylacetate--CoA ligase [Candidatus Binatia bacterium]|nr:phenylacetate--CoA ligase [Candidatus Binatia bacterium]